MGERSRESERGGNIQGVGVGGDRRKGDGGLQNRSKEDMNGGLLMTAVFDMWLPCHPCPPKI